MLTPNTLVGEKVVLLTLSAPYFQWSEAGLSEPLPVLCTYIKYVYMHLCVYCIEKEWIRKSRFLLLDSQVGQQQLTTVCVSTLKPGSRWKLWGSHHMTVEHDMQENRASSLHRAIWHEDRGWADVTSAMLGFGGSVKIKIWGFFVGQLSRCIRLLFL